MPIASVNRSVAVEAPTPNFKGSILNATSRFTARATGQRDSARAIRQSFLGTTFAVLTGLLAFTAPAAAENRTLDLYNTHTKERLTITFKKNGKFVASSLQELNRFLRDWRRNEPTNMDPRLFDTVWEVYRRSGSRQPVHVVSAYRSPATNTMLRSRSSAVAKNSQHTHGKAMDFFLPDVKVSKLREIGVGLQNGGVGYYPSANNPFVHIDVGSIRAWPRMNRDQLARIFPDGKTVHLPSDGKPLAGYQLALAELKQKGSIAPLAMAEEETTKKRKGGLLAILFGGEEDETEELNAASTTGQFASAANTGGGPVLRQAPAQPAAVAAAAPPPPPKAPAAPADPGVTSLAEATIAPGLVPLAAAKPEPLQVVAVAPYAPPPRKKPAELLALAAAEAKAAETARAEVAPIEVAPIEVAAIETAAVETAAVDVSVIPRPRPADAVPDVVQVAAVSEPLPTAPPIAEDEPVDARMALAEVARDPDVARRAPDSVLGYASAIDEGPAEPKLPIRMASLSGGPLTRGISPGGSNASLSPLPAEDAELKSDPLAQLSRRPLPVDLPIYDGAQTTYRGAFAQIQHPNQRSPEFIFTPPTVVVKASFDARPYGSMSSQGFSGVALRRLPVAVFARPRDYAAR